MSGTDVAVGLVGLGNLGRPIGLNLLERGWTVHVLDHSAVRERYLFEAGASRTSGPGLSDTGIICFVVPDETAIWQVLREANPPAEAAPLLDRLRPEHTVVVLSTILPSASQELAAAITSTGARYVEAPVSGGPERARSGDLNVFLAGTPDDLGSVSGFVAAIGSERHVLGDIGSASAAKLANQLIMLAALGGIHEALRLTRGYAIADQDLLSAIASGTAGTWVGQNWGFFDRVARDYNEAGVPVEQRPWTKDLREVIAVADSMGEPAPLAHLLARTVADQIERHATEADAAAESR